MEELENINISSLIYTASDISVTYYNKNEINSISSELSTTFDDKISSISSELSTTFDDKISSISSELSTTFDDKISKFKLSGDYVSCDTDTSKLKFSKLPIWFEFEDKSCISINIISSELII